MEKNYCIKCKTFVEKKLTSQDQVYKVHGKDIKIKADEAVCINCGTVIYDEMVEIAIINKLFNEYSMREKVPPVGV